MFDALKERLAERIVRRRIAKREVRPWPSSPSRSSVLLVLPVEAEAASVAWRFVERLRLSRERVLPIVPTGEIAYAPVEYIGRVVALNPEDIGRVGLPKRQFLKRVWSFNPDVALDLSSPDDLGAALIAGGSPAAFRVGLAGEGRDPFFDLMVGPAERPAEAFHALEQVLQQIHPPVLAADDALH